MHRLIRSILIFILIALIAMLVKESKAEDQQPSIKEMSMKTDTGELVLTTEPCTFISMGLQGYPYAAYATEKGHANHEGCWKVDVVDRFSAILVYFPEIDATAVYNPKLFQPRSTM